MPTIGIIGGTGLGDVLLNQAGGEPVQLDTPFGRQPSCDPILARWEGVDVAFISRHGPGHYMNPSNRALSCQHLRDEAARRIGHHRQRRHRQLA